MRNCTLSLPLQLDRFRCDERGVQLIEVAIVLPVLLVLLAATAEFGRYFYFYSTLSRATRTAVRHIATKPFTESSKTEAINLALCGVTTDCAAGTEILSGLTATKFSVTSTGGSTYFPETVTVQVVNYSYAPLFNLGNFAEGVTWESIPINARTTMRYTLSN